MGKCNLKVNNSIPLPQSTSEPSQSTFTRKPPVKSEAEIKMEERAAAKKVDIRFLPGMNFFTTINWIEAVNVYIFVYITKSFRSFNIKFINVIISIFF